VQSWSAETYEQTKAEGEQILSELSEMVKNTPDDPRVQALVKRYHEHLNTFNKMSKDMFGKVSDLYTDDKRFAAYYKRFHKNMPEFLQQAIKTYTGAKKAKSSKKK
jgi:2',3'-cyclic-nucleotide 2'-phosphodiesterase (5'-nucleotidase family)